jgi:hypothetical protein
MMLEGDTSATDPADDEDHDFGGRQPVDEQMPVDELGEAPAVDVLEHNAQIAVDALEIEDASDILVVEDRVTPRFLDEKGNEAQVGGVEQLLDHHRALEPGFAGEPRAVNAAHATRSELLIEDILAWHGSL